MSNIKIFNGAIATDDRGTVAFINDFDFANVKRFYKVENFSKGFIRAWHGHKNEGKYVYVVRGSIILGVVNLSNQQDIDRIVVSDKNQKIIYIPPNCANGFKTLEDDTIVLFFSTSTMEETKSDDIRFPYDQWDIWNIEQR